MSLLGYVINVIELRELYPLRLVKPKPTNHLGYFQDNGAPLRGQLLDYPIKASNLFISISKSLVDGNPSQQKLLQKNYFTIVSTAENAKAFGLGLRNLQRLCGLPLHYHAQHSAAAYTGVSRNCSWRPIIG